MRLAERCRLSRQGYVVISCKAVKIHLTSKKVYFKTPAARTATKRSSATALKRTGASAWIMEQNVHNQGQQHAPEAHQTGLLGSLSPEIMNLILDEISEKKHMTAMCRINRTFYNLMMPRLHRRLIVAAEYYAQIPAMIRSVEPYLSIRQRKEIKSMGKFKGQQETYPTDVDEDQVPNCCQFVAEVVIGASTTGKKHDKVVQKYYETVLGNLTNVHAVNADMLTPYITKAISSWKNIKSLSIRVKEMGDETASHLRGIRDLEHLCIEECEYQINCYDIVQGLFRNSISTLKSLTLIATVMEMNDVFFFDADTDTDEQRALAKCTSLRTLDFSFICQWPEAVERMIPRIDFTQLSTLKFALHVGSATCLFEPLTEAFTKATQQRVGNEIKLRNLLLSADYKVSAAYAKEFGAESEQESHEARFAFLASFSTLTSLEIRNYGIYPYDAPEKTSGFPDRVMDAILKHKGLHTLKLTNPIGHEKKLHLTVNNLDSLIRGLPHLENFVFTPSEKHIEDLAAWLTHGNFTSIWCTHEAMRYNRDPQVFRFTTAEDMLKPILTAYLNYPGADWEMKLQKLKQIGIFACAFLVSPQPFPKAQKGASKIRTLKTAQQMTSEDGTRSIWFQEIVVPHKKYEGYDNTLEWLNMATGHA